LWCQEKVQKNATTIVGSTDNNIGDVGDHAINLGTSHIEAPNAHDTDRGSTTLGNKNGIPCSKENFLVKLFHNRRLTTLCYVSYVLKLFNLIMLF